MKVRHTKARRFASSLDFQNLHPVCLSCRLRLSRRNYASAAAAIAEDAELQAQRTPPVLQAAAPKQVYNVQAGVMLSRPPQITRDLHPFEKAFFLYQRRLNERLALPFTRYHYFTRATPGLREWQRKFRQRQTPAHEIGTYDAYGKEGWNDELLMGALEVNIEHQVEALLKESIVPKVGDQTEDGSSSDEQLNRPAGRMTEADEKADLRSLARLLQRSLYLVVQNSVGRWTFPSGTLGRRENLNQAAERIIVQTGGSNMNTWVVGNQPIGYYEYKFPQTLTNDEANTEEVGEKIFFMKARIMAGQANLSSNQLGVKDFRWLVREEIEKLVTPKYWSAVRRMLPQR